jgi:hypothetical protein
MRTPNELPHLSRHYITDLDNHILVENHGGGVVIHASRDNFPERRKAALIRHLATEGHIPDRYEWFSEPQAEEFFGVRWAVDRSWSENDPQIERRGPGIGCDPTAHFHCRRLRLCGRADARAQLKLNATRTFESSLEAKILR